MYNGKCRPQSKLKLIQSICVGDDSAKYGEYSIRVAVEEDINTIFRDCKARRNNTLAELSGSGLDAETARVHARSCQDNDQRF